MKTIDSVLKESRKFTPPVDFAAKARLSTMADYDAMYQQSIEDPDTFFAKFAAELHWFEPWTEVRRWQHPHAEFFVGGKTNLAYNCLDRHLGTARQNKAALIWEGEPGDQRTFTYQSLHREVCRFANALEARGVKT